MCKMKSRDVFVSENPLSLRSLKGHSEAEDCTRCSVQRKFRPGHFTFFIVNMLSRLVLVSGMYINNIGAKRISFNSFFICFMEGVIRT